MAKDTQKEPVSSLEDAISEALDAADPEKTDDDETLEPAVSETEAVKEAPSDSSEEEEEPDDDDQEPDDDDQEPDDESDDLGDSEGEETDQLEPPEHWATEDKESFAAVPREGQEFLLKRHREMEAHFTRKNQDRADVDRQWSAVRDALAPHEQDFARAGLDYAGAVRQLASMHVALKSDGRNAIDQIAKTYGIDLTQSDEEIPADPALTRLEQQLKRQEAYLAQQHAQAQQRERDELFKKIQAFESETDESGNLKHPHFDRLQDEITGLLNSRIATSLDDAYRRAVAMSGLTTPAPRAVSRPKTDQAKTVKRVKRAATGVESSGSVAKKDSKTMTLEEEIASLIS